MTDINELVERKIQILMSYPFFKEFIESDSTDIKKCLDNLKNFSQQLQKDFKDYELKMLEELIVDISKIPKNNRLVELTRALTDISSFEVRNITFHIEPLSKLTMKDAIRLLKKVFPKQALYERADVALRASLALEKKGVKNLLSKLILRAVKISEVRYWIVINESSDKVIGITGLYCQKKDQNEADWGGWMCVDPAYRKYGIAFRIGDFTLAKARARGKKYLRLYTSTDPNEATANLWFDRKGFRIIKREPLKGTNLELLYREKEL